VTRIVEEQQDALLLGDLGSERAVERFDVE